MCSDNVEMAFQYIAFDSTIINSSTAMDILMLKWVILICTYTSGNEAVVNHWGHILIPKSVQVDESIILNANLNEFTDLSSAPF